MDQGIEGRHDRGNSDTMILATANPQKNTATMTSIPRDILPILELQLLNLPNDLGCMACC